MRRGCASACSRRGFGHPNSERDVDDKVRRAAEVFRYLKATVEEVSIPMHLQSVAIWTPIGVEGTVDMMMFGNGFGTNWRGLYATLARYDLLLMPTLPIKATPIPPPDTPRTVVIQRAHEMFANTAAFDITPYPALTLPCGLSDGLPVGMMLVAKQYDEAIYRAASAFERAGDWKAL